MSVSYFDFVEKLRTWFSFKSDVLETGVDFDINELLQESFPAAKNITLKGPPTSWFLTKLRHDFSTSSFIEFRNELRHYREKMGHLEFSHSLLEYMDSLFNKDLSEISSLFDFSNRVNILTETKRKMPNCIAFADTSKIWFNPPFAKLNGFEEICTESKNMLDECSDSSDYSAYKCIYNNKPLKDGDVLIYVNFDMRNIEKVKITHAAVYVEGIGILSKLGESFLVSHNVEDLANVPTIENVFNEFNSLKILSDHDLPHNLLVKSAVSSIYDVLGRSASTREIADASFHEVINAFEEIIADVYNTRIDRASDGYATNELRAQSRVFARKLDHLREKADYYDNYFHDNDELDIIVNRIIYDYEINNEELYKLIPNSVLGLKYFLHDALLSPDNLETSNFVNNCKQVLIEKDQCSVFTASYHKQISNDHLEQDGLYDPFSYLNDITQSAEKMNPDEFKEFVATCEKILLKDNECSVFMDSFHKQLFNEHHVFGEGISLNFSGSFVHHNVSSLSCSLDSTTSYSQAELVDPFSYLNDITQSSEKMIPDEFSSFIETCEKILLKDNECSTFVMSHHEQAFKEFVLYTNSSIPVNLRGTEQSFFEHISPFNSYGYSSFEDIYSPSLPEHIEILSPEPHICDTLFSSSNDLLTYFSDMTDMIIDLQYLSSYGDNVLVLTETNDDMCDAL